MTRNPTPVFSPARRAAVRMALTLLAGLTHWAPAHAALEFASNHPSLQDAITAAGPGGTLIVDQAYPNLTGPIVLPSRFRLVGLGIQGDAVLAFPTQVAGSALTIAPARGAAASWVEIEHIDIEGPFIPGQGIVTSARGIDLTDAHNVYIRNVTVRGFDVGIFGFNSQGIDIENANVSVNATDNYRVAGISTSWRISGGVSRFAGRHGVAVLDGNDAVIEGVVLESNRDSGVFTNTLGTHIQNNRFECHVHPAHSFCEPTTVAVRIGATATETTLVDNLYSGIAVVDESIQRSTYRFDNAHPVEISPQPGIDPLRIRFAGEAQPDFRIDGAGRVLVGPPQGTVARMTVNADANEDALRLRTGGITHLVLAGDGQLGVGTASPTAQLHINAGSGEPALLVNTSGSADPRVTVDAQGRLLVGPPSGVSARFTINGEAGETPLRIRNDGVTHFLIQGNGRVGLGTATPDERLHVEGNLKLNGNLVSDGEICIGSGC